jgi:glucose dehydrogenase
LFRIGSNPQYATLGRLVGKTGRTTELTQGRVVAVNTNVTVGGYPGGSAFFVGQTIVQDLGYDFSRGGDSGSVIWNWESGLPPVALLFAGGGDYTIGNPMPWVTYFLDINLYT